MNKLESVVTYKQRAGEEMDFYNIRLSCGMSFSLNEKSPWLRKFIVGYSITLEFAGVDTRIKDNKAFVNLKGVKIITCAPGEIDTDCASLPDVDGTSEAETPERHLKIVARV